MKYSAFYQDANFGRIRVWGEVVNGKCAGALEIYSKHLQLSALSFSEAEIEKFRRAIETQAIPPTQKHIAAEAACKKILSEHRERNPYSGKYYQEQFYKAKHAKRSYSGLRDLLGLNTQTAEI